MTTTADVVIIGAGVHGSSLAFHLARRRAGRIVAVEKQHVGAGSTGKSSGLIRMHYTDPIQTRLALRSYEWFQSWSERVGGSCGFTRTGFVRLVAERDVPKLRANVQMQQSVGVNVCLIRGDDLKRLEPEWVTDDVTIAAYEPDSGYADPWSTASTLMEAARAQGVELKQNTEVREITVSNGRVTGVVTDKGTIAAPVVVLLANVWATELARRTGFDLPLRAERHEVGVVERPPELGRRHLTCIDGILECYFRPEGENLTLVGTREGRVVEDPDRYDDLPTADFEDEVAAKISQRIPAMERARLRRGHAGLYDMSPDARPIVGRIDLAEGLYCAAGFSGMGFKIAPALGEALAELISTGNWGEIDLTPFRVSRFAEGQPFRSPTEYGDYIGTHGIALPDVHAGAQV